MAMVPSIRFALLALAIISLQHSPAVAAKKSYIVYLGAHSHGLNPTALDAEYATQSHYDLLESVLGSYELAQESLHYSYNKYINGFSASLTEDEAKRIKMSPNVISVIENRPLKLHTTRSWDFLGLEHGGVTLNTSIWNTSNYGENVIIGNLDTGVWPESESFNDEGLSPIPSRWKGACRPGPDTTFKCNKKLIGARYFHQGFTSTIDVKSNNETVYSARDNGGHGTHTLSTAGGSFVKDASIFGFGKGVAKGGAPKARVAAYKVCWPAADGGCISDDITAAFEAAIGDGVDVLSVSLGGGPPDFKDDPIAVGSFHAARHGIVVVASAGNDGPTLGTVSNVAPWIFTIGASSVDRAFANWVHLGNSKLRFKGSNLGPTVLPTKNFYPMIDGASAPVNSSASAALCKTGSLDPTKVKGKIVLCRRGGNGRLEKGQVVQAAGGVGMILANDELNGNALLADAHFLPASHITYKDGLDVIAYINKTKNPTAYITNVKTELGIKHSPTMASFSSRGPILNYPQLLKPDVTAPGVNVIAAFTGAAGPSETESDKRRVKYNVLSGTSMSCPHVSGIVGLLKSLHPDWSPAAIQSAIMTTATTYDNNHKPMIDYDDKPATPFGYGAGHVNPNAAATPGLIYDLTETDYLDFLCSTGSTEEELKLFSPIPHNCSNAKSILDFNYPSITVTNFTTSASLTRTLTNVGSPRTYKAKVTAPVGVSITVVPSKLNFTKSGQKLGFAVTLKATGEKPAQPEYVFGRLVWTGGKKHNVRSPIVVERV
ncbi:unnamed protein product [Rhodiola kirilowii]